MKHDWPVEPTTKDGSVETTLPSRGSEPHQGATLKPQALRGRGLRLLRGTLVFLILGFCGFLGFFAWFLISNVAKISTNPWNITPLGRDTAGVANILVLGMGDPGHAGEKLTDTILVMRQDAQTGRAGNISIPRDLRVQPRQYGAMKINALNAVGGPELTETVVEDITGTTMSGRVSIRFAALSGLVDAVGGLDVSVAQDLVDPEYPCADNQYRSCGLVIRAGAQHMDGATVLTYVRCRKGTCGNDFGRSARQQEILALLRPKLTDPKLILEPAKIRAITSAVTGNVETNLSVVQMLQFAWGWQRSSGDPISVVLSTKTDGLLRSDPAGSSDLLPVGGTFDAVRERVARMFIGN